jgi:hypothetical protein
MASSDGEVYYYLADASSSNSDEIDWSNIEAQSFEDMITIPEGAWWLHVKAIDLAGNQGEHEPVLVKVDMTPPTINWEIYPEVPDGGNGWYNSEPKVKLYSDSDGAEFCWRLHENEDWNQYYDSIILKSGIYNLQLKAVDMAGNIYETELTEVKVDITDPDVTIITPVHDQTYGSTMLATWSGMDTNSGLIKYKVRLDQKAWVNMDWETTLEFDNLNGRRFRR